MAKALRIEQDIPVPVGSKPGRAERKSKYPFASLEPGDSFFVAGLSSTYKLAGVLGHARAKHRDRLFISRTVEGGVRVWRLK